MASMETYYGQVRTPQDAIVLFEACRLGILPRVQRRLSEKERQQIRSGSVFVWDEREAGMRRWTDGKSWSASRVSGSFLTYREMEGKRGGFAPSTATTAAKRAPGPGTKSADGQKSGDSDQDLDEGPDGYRYKPDGLLKQSFSITTQDGRHLHLISYFTRSANAPGLLLPSNDPSLRNIHPQKGMYPEAALNDNNTIPAVTRGPLGGSPGAWPTAQPTAPPYPYPPNPYLHYPPHHGYAPPPWAHNPPGGPGPYSYYPPPHPSYQYPAHPSYHYPPSGYPPPPHPPTSMAGHMNPHHAASHPPPHHAASHPPPHPAHAPNYPPPPHHSAPGLRPHPYASAGAEKREVIRTDQPANGHLPIPSPSGGPNGRPPPATSGMKQEQPPRSATETPSPGLSQTLSSGTSNSTPRSTTIPSIDSLLASSGIPSSSAQNRPESGKRTPPGMAPPMQAREPPDPVSANGRERDRSDLKRLDSHSLKF
jgi:hypothetical protein